MSPLCPPGWRSTHGPQLWPGARGDHSPGLVSDGGGHQVWGAASGLGPPSSHCQLPPREPPALWHSGAGWGRHRHSQAPPCVGEGLWGCTWHPGGSCSARQCQGHPGPLQAVHRCFQPGCSCTPDSQRAAPPKTPLLPRGCGILGWAGEGSLCPAASGSGELLARHRSPGTLGEDRGLQAGTKRQWRHRGCMCVHACPCAGTHVSRDWGTCAAHGGLGSWPGSTPTP